MEQDALKIKQAVEGAENIVLLAHLNEDPDALGSLFAMQRILAAMGKPAVCILNGEPEKRLRFMEGAYTVYAGEQDVYDLCICLDCGSIDRLDKREVVFKRAKKTINIDHHATNTLFADINYVKKTAAAVGEILFDLCGEIGWDIDDRAAELLYTAIASDTGGFKYSNTTCHTMTAAAGLMCYSFDHAKVMQLLFDTVPLPVMRLRGEVMNRIQSYCGGKIQAVCVDASLLARYHVEETDAADFVNIPRMVEGTEIAIEMKLRDGKIRTSLRSNGKADVAEVALGFGGGGHIRAAGATLNFATMEAALAAVVAACEKALHKAGLMD